MLWLRDRASSRWGSDRGALEKQGYPLPPSARAKALAAGRGREGYLPPVSSEERRGDWANERQRGMSAIDEQVRAVREHYTCTLPTNAIRTCSEQRTYAYTYSFAGVRSCRLLRGQVARELGLVVRVGVLLLPNLTNHYVHTCDSARLKLTSERSSISLLSYCYEMISWIDFQSDYFVNLNNHHQ